MQSLEHLPDLQEALKSAQDRMLDPDCIWYRPARGFKTSVEFGKALVLGGVLSPLYLVGNPPWAPIHSKSPWVFWATAARLLVAETITSGVADWLPLMESLAKAGESLVIVTPGINSEPLHDTFLVNAHRQTLSCVPVLPRKTQAGKLEWFASQLVTPARGPASATRVIPYLAAGQAPSPDLREKLPLAREVWARNGAAVAFPGDQNQWDSLLSDTAMIHVGGQNHDEQWERLCALAKAVPEIETDFLLSL